MKNKIFGILDNIENLIYFEIRQSKSKWLDNEIEKLENIVDSDKAYYLDYKKVIKNSKKLLDISSHDDFYICDNSQCEIIIFDNIDNKKLEYIP